MTDVDPDALVLDPALVAALRERLPAVAPLTIDAVTAAVSEYGARLAGEQLTARLRETLVSSVELALGGFLRVAEQSGTADAGTPLQPVLDAAYALGRGEARSGRTMAALLAAYRVGGRVAWREWGRQCAELGMDAGTLARFAELVFAYMDALSAASVTGHSDELAVSGRVREQYRERLARALLDGEPEAQVTELAQRAEWEPPEAVTVVLLPAAEARFALPLLPAGTLHLPSDLAVAAIAAVAAPPAPPAPDGGPAGDRTSAGDRADDVLIVPGASRRAVLDALRDRPAVVGPARPWPAAAASLARAVRLRGLRAPGRRVLDTERHLTALVLSADPAALRDLRARVLAPLDGLRPDARTRLAQTLRSWLLHQGRRDDVAADLVVHPQTVRYRMTQLRQLFGDTLTDPQAVLDLTVALGVPDDATAPQPGA